jgi:hypothetical protein
MATPRPQIPKTPPLFIQFFRPRGDVPGPTLGPFPWVQVTYTELRVGPDADPIARYDEHAREWYLGRQETPIPKTQSKAISPESTREPYSAFLIFAKPS